VDEYGWWDTKLNARDVCEEKGKREIN